MRQPALSPAPVTADGHRTHGPRAEAAPRSLFLLRERRREQPHPRGPSPPGPPRPLRRAGYPAGTTSGERGGFWPKTRQHVATGAGPASRRKRAEEGTAEARPAAAEGQAARENRKGKGAEAEPGTQQSPRNRGRTGKKPAGFFFEGGSGERDPRGQGTGGLPGPFSPFTNSEAPPSTSEAAAAGSILNRARSSEARGGSELMALPGSPGGAGAGLAGKRPVAQRGRPPGATLLGAPLLQPA